MSSIYLAARYTRHPEMQNVARALQSLGHTVTSRWIWGGHQVSDDGLSAEGSPEERERFAQEDLDDLERADMLVAFTEPPRTKYTRGGRHVELGYALGRGKRVHIVGPAENVFCCLPAVTRFDSLRELTSYLMSSPVVVDDEPALYYEEPFDPSIPRTPCEKCRSLVWPASSARIMFKCVATGRTVSRIEELLQGCPLHRQEAVNG